MDFTINTYKTPLKSLQSQGYSFQTFAQFFEKHKQKTIVLRHDVDRLPFNSLKTAKLEHSLGINGSYYFRITPGSFNESVINEIAEMGNEIGYHYEDLTLCKGDVDKAYDSFCMNLEKLQKLYPVKTICMHGSPMSKWDSRNIWKKYDYKKLGIIAEPYFDINFNKIFYLTDTGRCWDGEKFNLRDKVDSSFELSFHRTHQIIQAAILGKLPEQIMFTFHPQRWSDNSFNWTEELVLQTMKNQVKRLFYSIET